VEDGRALVEAARAATGSDSLDISVPLLNGLEAARPIMKLVPE
jgi:hypothetical protein